MQYIKNIMQRLWMRQFIKYFIVGCIVTAIDMAALHLCYRVLHFHIKIAVIIGFMSGNISSFVFNKYFTFKNLSSAVVRQYTKYFVTSMTGLLWTLVLMTLFYEHWNLFAGITKYNYLICKMVVALLVMFWNFVIIRHWTLASYELPPLKPVEAYNKTNRVFLSVIIPAYNEQYRLPATLKAVYEWLKQQDFTFEIIVVDDGSTDDTVKVVTKEFGDLGCLRLYTLVPNQGKGAAVRTGMLMAEGEYRLFMDADHQIEITELSNFLPNLSAGNVLIGSKYMQLKESQQGAKISASRVFVSRLGNMIIRVLLNIDIYDTQCGFKIFPARVAESVFRLQKVRGFAFDVEILSLAQLHGLKIMEIPIVLRPTDESRVRTVRDSLHVFKDLLGIKMNIWRKKYHMPPENVADPKYQILRRF